MSGKRGPQSWSFGLGSDVAKCLSRRHWWSSSDVRALFPEYHRAHVLRVLAGLHRDGILERRGERCRYEYRKAQP